MDEYELNKLLTKINELEAELKTAKKYGLVWDKENIKEDVVVKCEQNIPILKYDENYSIKKGNGLNHILIEGDNYHILLSLNYVLRDAIDVIYIDPPYNTGEKDFKYNDTFVNEDDGYYHSKWLNFMEKRLKLAKNLLSPNGVILISIDEHEHDNLCLLCNSIFGQKVGEIIRKTKTVTGDSSSSFNLQHEYCLIYANKNSDVFLYGKEKEFTGYSNPDNDPNGPWVSADPSAKSGGPSTYFEIKNPYTGQIDLPPSGRYWAFSKSTLEDYVKSGRLVFKKIVKPNQRGFLFKRYKNKQDNVFETLNSLDFIDNIYMNQTGTKEAKDFGFVNDFKYPKPTVFIKKLLLHATNKNSIVLDFFAGSGTTGQAVMELNNEDGGARRFILCTNNENDICKKVTLERLKKVLNNNYNPIDGANLKPNSSNIRFFETDFISNVNNTDQAKYNLVEKVDSLLCIKEEVFTLKQRNDCSAHYFDNDKHLFIYNDFYNKEKFSLFKDEIQKCNGSKIVYIYSSDDSLEENIFEDKSIIVKPIPSKIYEIYREISETIKRGE